MAHPILPDEPEEAKKPMAPKPIQNKTENYSFFERVLTLLIAWQFFHFTGKAIASGQKLPKDWMKLKDRILPKRVKDLLTDEAPKVEKKPNSFKVIDVNTGQPIPIQ